MKDQIINTFLQIDDFYKEFDAQIKKLKLDALGDNKRRRNRNSKMFDSEIITSIIGFHLGAHKTFKHYYKEIVCGYRKNLFPNSLSYNRFIELQQRCFDVFAIFLKEKCLGKCTGISFMDSTTLKVCINQRIYNHKVFKGLSERGKSSMGWFYGFKLHLVCNEKGELLSFYVTKGNVDDRNPTHIKKMTKQLYGKLFADKGYHSKALWEMLFADGIQLFTKLRKNI